MSWVDKKHSHNYRAGEKEEQKGLISRRVTVPHGDRNVSDTGTLGHSIGL